MREYDQFAIQEFVPQPNVDAFVASVFSRAARPDEQHFHAEPGEPFTQHIRNNLRSVV
jgi:hypothetical protein